MVAVIIGALNNGVRVKMKYEDMNEINQIIDKLFSERWTENLANAHIDDKRKQLHKNLQYQVDGYWSGHTAYHIMVDGGFLIDARSGAMKQLTELGKIFMNQMMDAEK